MARTSRSKNCTALASITLLSLLLPLSAVATAQTADTDQAGSTQTDDQTYDGRTFEEWKRLSLHDLKPSMRDAAFEAFAAFAKEGREQEAVAAILAGLDRGNSPEQGVRELARFPDVAVPHLRNYLKSENDALRLYAVHHLANLRRRFEMAGGITYFRHIQPPERVFRDIARMAVQDESAAVRAEACAALGNMAMYANLQYNEETSAYDKINESGEPTPEAVAMMKALAEATKDPHQGVVDMAHDALWQQGEYADGQLQVLLDRFAVLAQGTPNGIRDSAWRRGRLNPVSSFRDENAAALAAFKAMGPSAKRALPMLESLVDVAPYSRTADNRSRNMIRFSRMQEELQEAIDAIKETAADQENAGGS